jgi:threonine-phosphate decarboxylase
VDEAFIDCCPKRSVRDRAAELEGLVVVGSLTKALCVPGVRLGYLIAKPEEVEKIESEMAPWSLNAFAAAIAKRLPGHLAGLNQDRARIAARREKFAAGLEGLGAKVFPSEASFLLCDFGRPMGGVAERLAQERILVRTCESFGLPDSCWRLAVKTGAQNARLIAALGRLL